MKISSDNSIRHYDNITYKSRIRNMGSGLAAGKVNRDQVVFESGILQAADKKTAAEAAHRVILEVRTATPQEKIDSLKQQVKEGTYRPDAEEIVSRMLLEKGRVAE